MNEHIIDYCKNRYIKSTMTPKFAVLIKGDWGCGKTHLVKKILEDSFGEDWEKQVICLSVYGLSTIQQVNQKLYAKIHPILTHKLAKFAGNVAKSALRLNAGFDLNNDNTNDVTLDISWSDIEQEQNGTKTKKLLVIDDIERCSIPPYELLGFFADSILDTDMKVIFIGNIKKMPFNDETEQTDKSSITGANKQEFDKIKEKIIGKEFKVEPDINEAIKFFISELKSKSINGIEDILTNKCIEVMSNLEYKNLRSVRQGFFHINQLLEILDDRNDKEYISKLVEYYFVVFFQQASGELIQTDATDAINAYFEYKKALKKYRVIETNEKNNYIVPLHSYHLNIPIGYLFADIIFDGKFDKKAIQEDYKKFTSSKDTRTTTQKMLQGWWEMDDKTFRNSVSEIKEDFSQDKFLKCPEIWQYAQLLFALSQNKIISKTYAEIKNKLFLYIEKNVDKIEYQRLFPEHTNLTQSSDWESEYKEILEKLKSNNSKVTIEQMKKDFMEWCTHLPNKFDTLITNIYNVNGEPKYKEYPILRHIDIQSFYENIQSLPDDAQRRIYMAFSERYQKHYLYGVLNAKYFSDIPKVKELSDLYKPDSEDVLMSPVNARKKLYAQWYNELYEWMLANEKEQTSEQTQSACWH